MTQCLSTREQHKPQVLDYLRLALNARDWVVSLPPFGTGHETYFASGAGEAYFIKLGIDIERYRVMSALGLSPRLIAAGQLEDGTPLVVQEKMEGRHPSRHDFHRYLDQFALALRKTHRSPQLLDILPAENSDFYRDAGLETLSVVEHRWQAYKPHVLHCADFVDESISWLKMQIGQFEGGGLAASHNDVCNGNWLVSTSGQVYLIDYESMSRDDPAHDVGAILWWYYPPELREAFLAAAGYGNDAALRHRMQIRMAVHCLNIILPRENSFDRFSAETFEESLVDFRAVLKGEENPQGYND